MWKPKVWENDHNNSTLCLYSTFLQLAQHVWIWLLSWDLPVVGNEAQGKHVAFLGQRVRLSLIHFKCSFIIFILKKLFLWPFLAISLETISWEVTVPGSNTFKENIHFFNWRITLLGAKKESKHNCFQLCKSSHKVTSWTYHFSKHMVKTSQFKFSLAAFYFYSLNILLCLLFIFFLFSTPYYIYIKCIYIYVYISDIHIMIYTYIYINDWTSGKGNV